MTEAVAGGFPDLNPPRLNTSAMGSPDWPNRFRTDGNFCRGILPGKRKQIGGELKVMEGVISLPSVTTVIMSQWARNLEQKSKIQILVGSDDFPEPSRLGTPKVMGIFPHGGGI